MGRSIRPSERKKGERDGEERETERDWRERVRGICDKVKNNNRIASQSRHDSPSSPSPPTETEVFTPRPRTSSPALCGSCRIIYAKYWHSVKPTTLHSLHTSSYLQSHRLHLTSPSPLSIALLSLSLSLSLSVLSLDLPITPHATNS
jgi:hypothetical protein